MSTITLRKTTSHFATRFAVAVLMTAVVIAYLTPRATAADTTQVKHRTVEIDGQSIFYREAGSADAPTILLLHGFPTSSHMFRNLIPSLADKFHLVAPDYPGYGNSSMPKVDEFDYTFDHLSEIIDEFTVKLGLDHYSLYLMDYGAPIGFRLAAAHPERVDSLIIQNGNAYDEGLDNNFWAPIKEYWKDRAAVNKGLDNDWWIGILVIDLRTRARLRVNGRVEFPQDNRLHVVVEQAFPNCPQYIQRRNYRLSSDGEAGPQSKVGTELFGDQQRWIANADTLFVASAHPTGGVDASHRGGNPGFIQIINSTRLRIPDYAGNGMFNTLGNLAANPHAGLVIPDFEGGRMLQLTGRAEILWDVEDPDSKTAGSRRYWDFEIERWMQIENGLSGTSEFLDYSPHNPGNSA